MEGGNTVTTVDKENIVIMYVTIEGGKMVTSSR